MTNDKILGKSKLRGFADIHIKETQEYNFD